MSIWKKRGRKGTVEADLVIIVFHLFIVALATGIMFTKIHSYVEMPLIDMSYLATDIALLSSAIYASPGNVFFPYNEGNGSFEVVFEKNDFNYVLVLFEGQESDYGRFPFYPNLFLANNFVKSKVNKLKFAKIDNSFIAGPDIKIDFDSIAYQAVDTGGEIAKKRIYFNAGEKASGIANAASQHTAGSQITETKIENIDMLVSVNLGDYSDKSLNPVKAYVPAYSKESYKLAALIINKVLLENKEFNHASIIPVNASKLDLSDEKAILSDKCPSVFLVIGNSRIRTFTTEESNKIGFNIAGAVGDYYKTSFVVEVEEEKEGIEEEIEVVKTVIGENAKIFNKEIGEVK